MPRILTAAGGWAFTIALALYAYYEDGIGGVAVALAVRALPAGLAAPYARTLAERVTPRAYLSATAAVRALALAAIAVLVGFDTPFWTILALVAVFRVAGAGEADGRRYDELGLLLGAASAALCMAVATLHAVFTLSALIFAAAAVAALWMPDEQAGTAPVTRRIDVVRAVRGGTRALVEVLVVAAAVDLVGITKAGVALLYAGWAVGMLVGARLLARDRENTAAAACVLIGAPLALLALAPAPAGAFVLLVAVGFGFALAPQPDSEGMDVLEAIARTLGAAAAAVLVAVAGDTTALVVAGSAVVALGLAAGTELVPAALRTNRGELQRERSPS